MKLNFRDDFPGLEPDRLAALANVGLEGGACPAAASQADDLASFYRQALDEAAIVEITDPLGTIVSVNDRFCDISGYARGELVGANHRLLRSGKHERAFFDELRRTVMRGQVWRGEICNRAKNGDLHWLDTTIVPHRRRDGAIERFIAVRFDITARKLAERRLRRMANVDPLTELPNRRSFERAVDDIFSDDRSSRGRIAVGVLDVDHFKDINDSLGHGAGDGLLRALAVRLRGAMGADDEVARLGGDEFGIILRGCAAQRDLHQRIDRIFAVFAAPVPIGSSPRLLSASVGFAMVPIVGGTRSEVLKSADIALHTAKANGRGRAELFDEAMQEEVLRRAELRDAFERGLHIREFVIHYQPIVALQPDVPVAMEALLRWDHPERGLIRPPQFLEALSDEHLATQVGGYVLEEVIGQIRQWRLSGVSFASVSVNATLGDFRARRYVDTILDAIACGHIVPGDICVEINEDVLVGRGGDCARAEIDRLHEAGVAIAFDDFGTGFASLRHLRDLPVDVVKIDKSFVRAIEYDSADRAIVGNVIDLAHRLGKSVTAEGVETPEQARTLQQLGCDRIQGFLIAQALPPAEIEPILAGRACLASRPPRTSSTSN